mgnify:CR=1 FL=1
MKRWGKIIVFSLLGVLVVLAALFGYGYYEFWGKFEVDETKYAHNVEYIDPEEAFSDVGFEVCDEERIAQYYNPKRASYSKGKNGLRNFILSNYENKGYTDSGYLNIRFIINCEGKAGRYIIHENNLDLEPTDLDDAMVEQIFKLTQKLEQWNPVFFRDKPWDAYMYLSYRIEHGEIIEILP